MHENDAIHKKNKSSKIADVLKRNVAITLECGYFDIVSDSIPKVLNVL